MLLEHFDRAWTVSVDKPMGVVGGIDIGPYTIPQFHWFPWASKRNKLECLLAFAKDVDLPLMWWSDPGENDTWVHIAKYGLIRRVGTTYPKGVRTPVWESKNA